MKGEINSRTDVANAPIWPNHGLSNRGMIITIIIPRMTGTRREVKSLVPYSRFIRAVASNKKRSMHHWVMGKAFASGKEPGVINMQTLVVAHDACS